MITLGRTGTLIDFGARGAQVDTARAAYDKAVADYRQAVLEALQEVEDNFAAMRYLADEGASTSPASWAALLGRRLTAVVGLIRALGGSW